MAKKKTKTLIVDEAMSARQLTVAFVSMFIGNALIIYFANMVFPQHVVLGTNVFSPISALFYSMVVFTLITIGFIPVIEEVSRQMNQRLDNLSWMVMYFFINAGALWLVARFAEQLGLGISSFVVAVILALIFDTVQGFISYQVMRMVRK